MNKFLVVFSLLFLSLSIYAHDEQESDFHFTQNIGQLNKDVKYHCKLHVGDAYFLKNSFTFDLYSAEDLTRLDEVRHNKNMRNKYGKQPFKLKKHAYSMQFVGANNSPQIITEDKIEYVKNYIKGNDPSNWFSGVTSYKKINYKEIYNGVDLSVYSKHDYLKYDFLVKRNANPSDIEIDYKDVEGLKINNGILEITLSTGVVKELNPIAYQTIDGQEKEVSCKFVLNGNKVSFTFPNGYDKNYDLLIDPTWVFSTLTGSSADNWGFTATYDNNGNFYGGGIAFAAGFPVSGGAYDVTFGGNVDAAIIKYNPLGTGILYATYIGGNNADQPHSLVTDAQGNLIVMGVTSSTNFPTSVGAFSTTFNGGSNLTEDGITYGNGTDIYVAKLDPNGANLLSSTYLGGSSNDGFSTGANLKFNYADHARGEVVIDSNNDIYIASSTSSNDYSVTAGSLSQTLYGNHDGVVSKLSSNMNNLVWSTYIGGASDDAGYSVRIDEVNNSVFVCGGTESNNLPTTSGVVKPSYSAAVDGYVASLDISNGALKAMTYLGTNSYDQAYILELDDNNDVYVVGQTRGTYPVTVGTYSNANGSQFIHKLNNGLTLTDFSTVFGSGSAAVNISITAFLVDNCQNIYVSGWGGSTNNEGTTNNMPITGDALQSSTDGSDFYFIVLDRDAQNLLYGTYFGSASSAEHVDGGTSRFDKQGTIYQGVCAACGNTSFPTSPGAYSSTNGSTNCNFGAIKIGLDFQGILANATPPPNLELCGAPYDVSFTGNSPVPANGNYWDFGDGIGTDTATNPIYTYADTGTYQVMYVVIDSTTCNITDTSYFNVTVLQNDSLDAQFLFPPYDPCDDSLTVQLDFTGSGADSLYWDMGNGSTFINDTSVSYTYTSNGNYVVTLEAYDLLCNNSFTLTDTVFFNPNLTTVTASPPPNVSLCTAPYDINFTGNTPTPANGSYWDFGDGSGTSNLNNPMYTYADTGTYQVMYVAIDSSTCNIADTAYFNVTLNLNDTLDAQFSFPPYDPCTDSLTVQLDFTGSGADSLYWDMGNGSTFINDTSVTYTYVTPGVYVVSFEAYDFTCNNTATITDTVVFTPNTTTVNATIPPSITLCTTPLTVDFTGNTPAPPNSYWDFGDGVGTSTQNDPSYTYATSGIYTVTYVAIDSSTCNIADTTTAQVTLTQAPPVDATIDFTPPPPCGTDSFFVDLEFTGSGADSIMWDMGDGTVITTNQALYLYGDAGTYTITMTAYNSLCGDKTVTNEVRFTEAESTEGIIPNVFTPNGDGMNDKLEFIGVDATQSYSVTIFNRWGQQVYEGTDALAHWDGGGHKTGVYFYVLRYTDLCSDEERLVKGYVTMLRE